MWKHLHKHNIILHFQHGFQSGLSCESQLIETVHDWMTAMDNKTQIDAILLDFAKAFDKVPHLRLLSKLTSYGITGNTQNWIKSFLSNRKQRVSVNGVLSDITDVTSGVPQGPLQQSKGGKPGKLEPAILKMTSPSSPVPTANVPSMHGFALSAICALIRSSPNYPQMTRVVLVDSTDEHDELVIFKTDNIMIVLNDASQLPADYSSTPGGTLFSTTPGGTRIIYDRAFLLECRNSPLTRSPPPNLPKIPGVTCPQTKKTKENGHAPDAKVSKPAGMYRILSSVSNVLTQRYPSRQSTLKSPSSTWISEQVATHNAFHVPLVLAAT
ncbi:Eukaryotic translation initiation factor 4E-binding protein 1 [Lamellibrachia satsuma]|nr:Eukaryotic translation initiation factor 4E-binding protein 1 [Lamellibrachia satsuma]